MNTVSAVINTLNEEGNIADCIKSLQWTDEVIVVDQFSDDKTSEIARSLGAKVYTHKRTGFVEPARNFAIKKAKSDWVFVVDADERIPDALAKEIKKTVRAASDEQFVFNIAERNEVFGKWIQHGTLWPDFHPRLFRKGSISWPKTVHDRPELPDNIPAIGPSEELSIHHFSRSYMTLAGFLKSYIHYSEKEADAMKDRDYKFRRRHIVVIPWREFKLRYFKTQGYKDGFHGLAIALLFTCYRVISVLQYWEKYKPTYVDDTGRGRFSYVIKLFLDK